LTPAHSESLGDFLTERRADRDTIQQAARYAVAELGGDLSADEMLDELRELLAEPGVAQATVNELSQAPTDLTDTALWVLTHLWYDLGEPDVVAAAVVNAQTKLPVIEITVIAASVLYGLHLIMTRGIKRSHRKIEYNATDGSYTETSTTEYYAPAAALRLAAGARDSDTNQVSD